MLFSVGALFVTLIGGLIFLQVSPPTELTVNFGIDLKLISSLVFFMRACALVSLLFFLKGWYRVSFSSLVGLITISFIVSLVTIIPTINPYRSTRQLGMEMDSILPSGEKLVFYRRLSDSALFYTNRQALVHNSKAFVEYFSSDHRVYCIAIKRHLEKLEKRIGTNKGIYIVNQEGNKVLLSNRKSPG